MSAAVPPRARPAVVPVLTEVIEIQPPAPAAGVVAPRTAPAPAATALPATTSPLRTSAPPAAAPPVAASTVAVPPAPVSPATQVSAPVSAPASASPPADWPSEQQIAQKVLQDVQRQIDGMLDFRLREAMAPVLARHADSLVQELRAELSRTLGDVVHRAVSQELAKLRQR
jgi:hypothetical protein